MTKSQFLVCYEYGMGAVWGFVRARSKQEIRAAYPELIVAERQPWMSDVFFSRLRAREMADIDDEPAGVLAAVVADRRQG